MQAGFTQQQADAITDVLGQCSQALEHRGPVTLSGPDPTGPDGKPIPTDGAGDQYALNVTQGSTFNNQGDTINNGDTFNTTNSTINNNENVVNNNENVVNNTSSTVNNDNSTITNTSVTETYDSTSDIDFDSANVHGGPVGKAMVNASDALAYLEDQMADGHVQASAQYNSSQDWKIEVDTIDSGGDKKLRFFGDASDLTNWDNSHEWVLGWTASGSLNVFAWGLVKVGKADSDIDAITGATPGTGDVTVWRLGDDGDYAETDETVTGVNLSSSAVTADTFLILVRSEGAWLIVFEACP